MAINPDITQYVNLKIYDKNPQDLVDAAVILLQSRLPEWTPSETNIEMMLIEAMALEVSESVYAINRLPNAMLEVLLTLYGVIRDSGTPPTTTLLFTMSDTAGYIIPVGTEVSVPINATTNLSFTTNISLTIPGGTSTGTVVATGVENTKSANGVISGTNSELVSGVANVLSVETASVVANGVSPEETDSWLSRGIQKLQRLTNTLVIPQHFTDYCLEQTYVNRANTIDNFDISLGTGVPGNHPGHVSVIVYGFSGLVSAPNKVILQALLSDTAIGNIGVHLSDPTITTVNVTCTVKALNSYLSATVLANVTTALTNYLSPNNWQWSGTVRINELIALISGVEGVDYVTSLTLPASDIVLGANKVLANVGVLTITVT